MTPLPKSWTETSLGELITDGPTNGYSPQAGDGATGTWSFKLSATTSGRFLINDETKKRLYETIATDSKYWLQPGDLLIQRSNTLEYVGTAAIYDGPADSFIYPDTMMRLRFAHPETTRWVWRYMNAPTTRHHLRQIAGGAASSMSKISGAKLREMMLPLPPLPEQKRIAAILDKADAIRRKRQEAIRLTEELLRSAFLEMFGDPVTNPKGWEVKKLGEVFDVQLGKMLNQEAKKGTRPLPYLGNRHVQWGRLELQQLPEMHFSETEQKKFELRKGDLLVCEGGEVGRTAIWHGHPSAVCYQKALHRLRPKRNAVIPEYMLGYMREASKRGLFVSHTAQTSIAHLTREKLLLLDLMVPEPSAQNKYQRFCRTLLLASQATCMAQDSFTGLHDTLTQRAFSGKL